MPEAVERKIRDFIVDNFLFGETKNGLGKDDSLLEKGLIDSTGILELVAFLQDTFHISVEDDEIIPNNLDSIHRITGYVQRKNGSSNRPNGGGD